jgi:hypothetical protein
VEPRTAAGRRAVALDRHTVRELRDLRRRQLEQRDRLCTTGKVWADSGYVFTGKTGTRSTPNYATTRFRILTARAELPPSGRTTCGTASRPWRMRPARI